MSTGHGAAASTSEADDVSTLSVKALKQLIASAGLTHADCLEKAELQARAREARRLGAAKAVTPPDARWVTCPLCSKQFAARSEEECSAHMAECAAFAAKHGPGATASASGAEAAT